MKPQFFYCHNELGRNSFNRYGLFFSQKFCEYFTDNFTALFWAGTGLKPSFKVTLAGFKQPNDLPIYESGAVSKLNLVLWIMPEYMDNISFCWRSKTGEIIKTTDETFNEDNIECWIEGIKPLEYWKQVATEKKSHPFQISNLGYELKVFDFGVEMEMRIFSADNSSNEIIQTATVDTIQQFNDQSEANARINGVVHNSRFLEEENYIHLRIDTGSAGVEIIRKILKVLSKTKLVTLVELDL